MVGITKKIFIWVLVNWFSNNEELGTEGVELWRNADKKSLSNFIYGFRKNVSKIVLFFV